MGALVGVGDGVGDDGQFVASFVGRPGGWLDADAGRNAGQDNSGDLSPAEFKVELGAVERFLAVFGDQDVAVAQGHLGAELAIVGNRPSMLRPATFARFQ